MSGKAKIARGYPGGVARDVPKAEACACRRFFVNRALTAWPESFPLAPGARPWVHTKRRCGPRLPEKGGRR